MIPKLELRTTFSQCKYVDD